MYINLHINNISGNTTYAIKHYMMSYWANHSKIGKMRIALLLCNNDQGTLKVHVTTIREKENAQKKKDN